MKPTIVVAVLAVAMAGLVMPSPAQAVEDGTTATVCIAGGGGFGWRMLMWDGEWQVLNFGYYQSCAEAEGL